MKKIIDNLPFWCFWLVVFSLPFVNLPDLRNSGLPIQGTDLLFLITALVYGIYIVVRKARIRWTWFYAPLTIYFFSLCLSTYFSEDIRTSLVKLLGSVYLVGLAKLGFGIVDDNQKHRKIANAWLIATFLVCFVSISSLILFYVWRDNPILIATLSHYGSLPPGNYARIQSTFINPNMLCNYLNVGLAYILLAFRRNWLPRPILYLFSISIAITAILTFSPGIGGLVMLLGIWFWLDLRTIKPLFAKLSLFLGVAGALFFFLSVLPSPTNFPDKLEPSPRILTWKSAIETVGKFPISGRGMGLDTVGVNYNSPNGSQHLGDAHQLLLNVWAQQGTMGLFAMLFLIIWILRMSAPFDLENEPIKTALRIAFICAFCYQGLAGSFEDTRHLWVLIGLLTGVSSEKSK